MKQTKNYQLNLIEGDDIFSPDPLNANAEMTDAALTGLNAELSARIAAISAAMGTGGATARIAFGSYVGKGRSGANNKVTLTFEFQPILVVVMQPDGRHGLIAVRGMSGMPSYFGSENITFIWGGSSLSYYGGNSSGQLDMNGNTYFYMAVGV